MAGTNPANPAVKGVEPRAPATISTRVVSAGDKGLNT